MKRAFRLIASAGALGAAALGLSACDGSPPAVSVDGHVLSVATLNHQLAQWVSDKALVAQLNQSAAQQAASAGGPAQTVVGAGGPGTYSKNFVSQVLGFNIESIAIKSYLARHGQAATPEQRQTARAYEAALRTQYWDALPEALKEIFVNFLANEGVLTPPPTDPSTAQQGYTQLQPWLFSSVCVLESVSPDLDGANAVVASGRVNGAQVCFDQQKLEAQPQDFQAAVTGLAKPGDIAKPLKTSYGYVVLQLTTRKGPPLDTAVAQVLTAASSPPQALSTIVTGAKVSVNPAYGSWSHGCLVPPGDTAQEACGSHQ